MMPLIKIFILITLVFHIARSESEPTCTYKAVSDDPSEIQFEHLYKLALKESRTVHVLEGGDEKSRLDWTRDAFQKKFPCLKVDISIDLSKYHDARINSDLAQKKPEDKLLYDVATLQTVHNYYNWKDQGFLVQFTPPGFSQIPDEVKDPEGYFMPIKMLTFSHYAKKSVVNKPKRYNDYLAPEWGQGRQGQGKLVLTYPHDDDAVLYQFYQALKLNPNFLEALVKQNPRWIRGTIAPQTLINKNVENFTVTFTTAASFHNDKQLGDFTLPDAPEIFLTWPQMSAIFKDAPNLNTAKLWLTWWLSKEQQEAYTAGFQWAARKDVKVHVPGMKYWTEYNNTSPKDFIDFMRNRTLVNELSEMVKKIIGPVLGVSPLEDNI